MEISEWAALIFKEEIRGLAMAPGSGYNKGKPGW
jgi:hypothetical protein